MSLPQIIIDFKTKANTAISRHRSGAVGLILEGTLSSNDEARVYTSIEQVTMTEWTPLSQLAIRLAFMGNPSRVICFGLKTPGSLVIDPLVARMKTYDFEWLSFAYINTNKESATKIIDAMRKDNRPVKGVILSSTPLNHEAMVCYNGMNYFADLPSDPNRQFSAEVYGARIASLFATLPLGESATFYRLPELRKCTFSAGEPTSDAMIRFIQDDKGFKMSRAVTSLTTVTDAKPEQLKKIKIVQAMDAIRYDIRTTLEESYIGRVQNTYDSKLLLAGAIQGYFETLGGDVIDKSYENRVSISYDGQRKYLISKGIDVSKMSEQEILKANTGSSVFLTAQVRFVDAIEDIEFVLNM